MKIVHTLGKITSTMLLSAGSRCGPTRSGVTFRRLRWATQEEHLKLVLAVRPRLASGGGSRYAQYIDVLRL